MESLIEESEQRSMNQVFNDDMLREMIIGYVISDEIARGSSRNDLRSLRLVQKSWLRDACKYFIKVRKPLYHIQLTKENSLNGSQAVQQTGHKLLDRFTRAISTRLEDLVPPFRLSISAHFFQKENHTSFSKFLASCCTAGLIQLEVSIPNKGGSMTYIFPNANLYFPFLKELVFRFTKAQLQDVPVASLASSFSNSDAVYLLQSILRGTTNLTDLRFPITVILTRISPHIVPDQVEYLFVPPTVTNLNVSGFVKSSQLNFLLMNQLPMLTELEIRVTSISYHTGFLFKLLDNVRTTLRILTIQGQQVDQRNPTFFKFPLMEKLKCCNLYSMHAELEAQLEPLEDMLPELSLLSLLNQTVGMLEKWTRNSRFPRIIALAVSLVNENARFGSREFPVTFNLETMQSLQITFPNIRTLVLVVCGMDTSGLKHLFLAMTELRNLTICFKHDTQHVNPNHWDALITGVPVVLASALRTTAEFWPHILIQEDESIPSIKRLQKLQSLSLKEFYHPSGPNARETSGSLVSDVLFHFALLKMPNLKTLSFTGRFKASPEMAHAWRNDKDRTFDYMAAAP